MFNGDENEMNQESVTCAAVGDLWPGVMLMLPRGVIGAGARRNSICRLGCHQANVPSGVLPEKEQLLRVGRTERALLGISPSAVHPNVT